MAGLDLHGFTAPVDQYGGLYQVASDMNKRNAERQAAKDKASANQASMAKFLVDYTNPKDHLTGTLYDPIITKGYSDILQEGTKLIQSNPSLTTDMLLTALAPKVGQLSTYSEKAKTINDNIKLGLQGIGENSGYDKFKLEAAAKKKAFLDDNGQMKDLQLVDPNINYVTQAVKDNPFDVTNNKGIDEWLKSENRFINSNKVKQYNSRDGYDLKEVKTNAYSWAVPNVDNMGVNDKTFVPAYDEVMDDGKKLMHDFSDGKGGVVAAPVRMVKEPLFKSIMSNSSGTADWVRGQVLQHIKDYKDENGNPIDINSPQANNMARAILYDELKTRGLGGMEDVVENKPAQTKNYNTTNVNLPNDKNDGQIIDLYKNTFDIVNSSKKDGNMSFTSIPSKAQDILLGKVRDMLGDTKKQITPSDLYMKVDKDGRLLVVTYGDKPSLVTGVDENGKLVPNQQFKNNTPLITVNPEDLNIEINKDIKNATRAETKTQKGTKIPLSKKNPLGLDL